MNARLTCVALLTAILAGVLLCGWAPAADEKPESEDEDKPSYWMVKKMEYSERILSGLATGDYEVIQKNAETMNALNQIEKYVRGRTPGYRTQLRFFRFANEQLIKHAEKENLDGAALAFTQLTLSCVNCHKLIRDEEPAPAEN